MSELSSKKKVMRAVYITLSLLFLFYFIGSEFFWRFDTKLDIRIHAGLRDSKLKERMLTIHEQSNSQVDTSRRQYKDILHGITNVSISLDGSSDTIHISLTGKYYSEARPLHISADSSTQILLIPNTLQGLPAGSNKIIYLQNDSILVVKEFFGFIGNVDHDGSEEVNIPEKGGWMRLSIGNGEWIPAQLRSTP